MELAKHLASHLDYVDQSDDGFDRSEQELTGDLNLRQSLRDALRFRRRAPQLKFHLEAVELARTAALTSHRPISNDTRRLTDSLALVEHFKANSAFWDSIIARLRKDTKANALKPLLVPESLELGDVQNLRVFLRSLIDSAEDRIGEAEPDLCHIVVLGLIFLTHQLQSEKLDGTAFRTIWLLLWPVLNDFGLLPETTKSLRGVIQKIVTQSF